MGVRVLEGIADGTRHAAVLFDATTEIAFGPLFRDVEEAEDFLRTMRVQGNVPDVRRLSMRDLEKAFLAFRKGRR